MAEDNVKPQYFLFAFFYFGCIYFFNYDSFNFRTDSENKSKIFESQIKIEKVKSSSVSHRPQPLYAKESFENIKI